MALAAKNLARSNIGRSWMAVRDMDVAAEVIGIRLMPAKLTAFAISSFYAGVAGALYAFMYLGTVEPEAYNLDLSFRILFMIIIGGVGTILGSFLGSAFIVLLPIFLNLLVGFLERRVHLYGAEERHVEPRADGVRRADHLLPDRRAARPRAAVADRQGKAAAMAVPALMVRRSTTDPDRTVACRIPSNAIDTRIRVTNAVQSIAPFRGDLQGGEP